MNWFWKHIKTGAVIHPLDYENLRDEHKQGFVTTEDEPTHQVEDEEDDGTPILTALVMAEVLSSGSAPGSGISDDSSVAEPEFKGFAGGDGGGSGAGGDFSSDNPNVESAQNVGEDPNPDTNTDDSNSDTNSDSNSSDNSDIESDTSSNSDSGSDSSSSD